MRSLLQGAPVGSWGGGGGGSGGGGGGWTEVSVRSSPKQRRTFGQFTRFLTHDTEEIMIIIMDISGYGA